MRLRLIQGFNEFLQWFNELPASSVLWCYETLSHSFSLLLGLNQHDENQSVVETQSIADECEPQIDDLKFPLVNNKLTNNIFDRIEADFYLLRQPISYKYTDLVLFDYTLVNVEEVILFHYLGFNDTRGVSLEDYIRMSALKKVSEDEFQQRQEIRLTLYNQYRSENSGIIDFSILSIVSKLKITTVKSSEDIKVQAQWHLSFYGFLKRNQQYKFLILESAILKNMKNYYRKINNHVEKHHTRDILTIISSSKRQTYKVYAEIIRLIHPDYIKKRRENKAFHPQDEDVEINQYKAEKVLSILKVGLQLERALSELQQQLSYNRPKALTL
jgi:hypothetical protein